MKAQGWVVVAGLAFAVMAAPAARADVLKDKGCLNCHSAVHGSNHPSGVTLLR